MRDAWPRTDRLLPWLVALFVTLLWLVPVDSIQLGATGPVDFKLDRLVLGAMFLVWLAAFVAGGPRAPRLRDCGAVGIALLLLVAAAILSVLANLEVLVFTQSTDFVTKRLLLLASYVAFFVIAATSIRPAEVGRFALLFLVLACVCALGALYQKFGGQNLSFELRRLLPDSLFEFRPLDGFNRFTGVPVTGPARHGLALAGMLAMALPFAIVGLMRPHARRWLYGVAAALVLLGVWATSRKTGLLASGATLVALTFYRPGAMLFRILPAGFLVIALLSVVNPDAVQTQVDRLQPEAVRSGISGQGRENDYPAIVPDVRERLLTGRGWGSYDPNRYRILDNNLLLLLVEVGVLGVAVFLALIGTVAGAARAPARSRDPAVAGAALAAGSSAAAFLTAMLLFDALGFAQVPYLFLFLAALLEVSRRAGDGPSAGTAETSPAVTPRAPVEPPRLAATR